MKKINKTEAQALWNRVRSGLMGLERDLKEIVENRAWEPLGYVSFVEAWEAELAGVELSGIMEASAVLALYSSGATIEEVQSSVSGVGPVKAKAYHQAHRAEMDTKQAYNHAASMSAVPTVKLEDGETWAEAHVRKRPERRNSILLDDFTDQQIESWKKYASASDVKFKQLCRTVFIEAMNNATKG